MIHSDKRAATTIDLVGLRGGFGLALESYIRRVPSVINSLQIITPDTSTSGGLSRLLVNSPELFVNTGISEQAAVLIGAGLSSEGFTVFVATFAPFLVFRGCEQIRLVSSYMNLPVRYVGYGGGLDLVDLGYTHCCIEDVAIMRCLGLDIYTPSCGDDLLWSISNMTNCLGSSYLRLSSRGKISNELSTGEFDSGTGIRLLSEKNVKSSRVIVSYGSLTMEALSIAKDQRIDLVTVSRINDHSINSLSSLLKSYNQVFVMEDHLNSSGLGVILKSLQDFQVVILGHLDSLSYSGDWNTVIDLAGLSVERAKRQIDQNT